MFRAGIKTTEFWVTLIAGLLATAQASIWPDNPFPKESFIAVILWVGARMGQKTLGPTDTAGKRAWQTTDFWLTMVFSVVSYFIPTIPPEIFNMVSVYIVGRPLVALAKDFDISSVLPKNNVNKNTVGFE